MLPKNENRTPACFSMLALPFSILLIAMALSSLTILTLGAEYLDRRLADSGRKTARRGHLRLATSRGKVLIGTIQKA